MLRFAGLGVLSAGNWRGALRLLAYPLAALALAICSRACADDDGVALPPAPGRASRDFLKGDVPGPSVGAIMMEQGDLCKELCRSLCKEQRAVQRAVQLDLWLDRSQ